MTFPNVSNSRQVRDSSLKSYCQTKILLGTRILGSTIISRSGPRDDRAAGGVKTHLSKIPRLEISGGNSQEDFRQFMVKWGQYVRASNVTDDGKLRDDLMQCQDTALEKAVHRSMGAGSSYQCDGSSQGDRDPVIKQSNHVNILGLMQSKQEHDEPV